MRVGEGQGVHQGQGGIGPDTGRVGRAHREVRQGFPRHQPGSDGGDGAVGGLGDERHGAGGAGVHFQHIDVVALDGELDVHQADHMQGKGHLDGLALDFGHGGVRQGMGRQAAGAVAGMDTGLFNMFHDSCDMHVPAVGQGIDIHFDCARQIAVEQDGAGPRNLHGGADVAFQLRIIADDFHGTATEDEGGADDEGVADGGGDLERLIPAARRAVDGLLEAEGVEQFLEPLPVFGQINRVRRGAEDRDAFGMERIGEFQGRLAAELDDHAVQGAVFLFDAQDFKDVFKGQGFKIQPV